MIKRVGLAILPALIVLGLTGPIAGAEDQGYIVLEKARYHHQQGTELERLEKKYSDYEKTLDNLLEKEQFVEAMAEKHYQQVEQQLEKARKRIARDYEEKIIRFKQEIEEGLAAAKEEVQEQAQQELLDFEGELQERYQEEMAGRLEEYNQKYRDYRAEIREEYSFEIFNLRLQLDLARLSESERAKKEEQLEKLEQEKKEALREKEEEIAWGVKTFSLRLQLELGEKIADFVEVQEQRVQEELNRLQEKWEQKKIEGIEEFKREREQELEEREQEIRAGADLGQVKAGPGLQEDLGRQKEKIISKKEELEQEIIELQGIIDKEIEELVEQLAREKGVEIAVLEENKGQEGVDFTPDLIEMLD